MDFLSRGELTLLLTLLAERVCCKERLSDLPPASAVAFGRLRVTLVAVVVAVNLTLMFLAVPAFHQLRTAGE